MIAAFHEIARIAGPRHPDGEVRPGTQRGTSSLAQSSTIGEKL